MADLTDISPPWDSGPPPMSWEDYSERATAEFRGLLGEGAGEKEMQRFLEGHPALVPGAFPGWAGHGAWPDGMVAQPPLQGFGHRRPDFLWIARHSGAVEPVFIEIEDPGKQWLAGGSEPRPSHQLTQALNQLRQWREWLSDNREVFFNAYAIPPEWRRRGFSPRYLLIYGRKGENPEEITRLRQDIRSEQRSVETLTYDHLEPIEKHRSFLTLRCDGTGHYEALTVPATARLGGIDAEQWRLVSGRQAAVEANDWISEERKRYLREFLPHCDDWANNYEQIYETVMREMREQQGAARST